MKIVTVTALVIAVGLVLALKQQGKKQASVEQSSSPTEAVVDSGADHTANGSELVEKKPLLLDLGAGKCTPCKMMKPILDELKTDYSSQFKVKFIDVWENPEEAKKYDINMIPTQIFYDSEGNELFRHEGFYSKEDILGKWQELEINIEE